MGGYHPQDPHSLCPQLNLLNPSRKKIPGYATADSLIFESTADGDEGPNSLCGPT